jgi:hypothetical protein
VTEFLVAKKESVRNIHKHLCNVYGSAGVDRSTVDHWVKRVTASKTGKAELHNLPPSGHPVTASSSMLMPWIARTDTSQLDNWHSVFQSVKEVSVTSSEILDI